MALACAGVPQPKSAQPGETLNQAYAKAIAEGGPRRFIVKASDRENEAIALAYLAWNFPGFVADSTLSEFSIFVAELEPKQLLGVVSELEGVVDFIECDQAVSLGGGGISISWPPEDLPAGAGGGPESFGPPQGTDSPWSLELPGPGGGPLEESGSAPLSFGGGGTGAWGGVAAGAGAGAVGEGGEGSRGEGG